MFLILGMDKRYKKTLSITLNSGDNYAAIFLIFSFSIRAETKV